MARLSAAMLRGIAALLLATSAAGERRAASPDGALAPSSLGVPLTASLPLAPVPGALQDGFRSLVSEHPSVLEGDDAHHRTSRHLADVLGIRGGAAVPPSRFWTVMKKVDYPVRVALMSWGVYDKTRRVLKLMVPKPFFEECEEFFLMVAGVELHAMEALKGMLEKAKDAADADPEAHHIHLEAIKKLSEHMLEGAQESADFALKVGKKTFRKAIMKGKHEGNALRHAALRIADAVHHKDGKWQAKGNFLDLSGGALEEAAEIDVTQELVPDHVHAKTRLKLLGLVASLGHESVFHKVQHALHHDDDKHTPYLSIEDFKHKLGVNSAAELVKKMIHRYATPQSALHGYLAVYTLSHLRRDPMYFQVSWGFRLAALVAASHFDPSPVMQQGGNLTLAGFHVAEARARQQQLFEYTKLALAGTAFGVWDRLRAADAALALILFAAGRTDHEELTMETMYDWMADQMLD